MDDSYGALANGVTPRICSAGKGREDNALLPSARPPLHIDEKQGHPDMSLSPTCRYHRCAKRQTDRREGNTREGQCDRSVFSASEGEKQWQAGVPGSCGGAKLFTTWFRLKKKGGSLHLLA